MKNRRALFVLGLGVLIAIVFAAPAGADVYMKQKTHVGAFKMMGKSLPEKDMIVVGWLSGQKVRMDTAEGSSMLYDAGQNVIYSIDHNKKQYSEIPMNFDKMIEGAAEGKSEKEKADAKKMAEKVKGMVQEMMGQISVNVTETGETKKIGDWNCRKYLIDMNMGFGQSKAEAWVTQDLKFDTSLLLAATNAMMAQLPGVDKLAQEMQKLKGVTVRQTAVTMVMGTEMTMTTELIECEEKSALAGTFDIPAGYQKVKKIKL